MKKLFFFLLPALLGTAQAQSGSLAQLAGRWETAEGAGIEIVDSTRAYLLYGDQKKKIAHFTTDFSKIPAWFDFTVADSTDTLSLKSLLSLINPNLLQWQVFEDGVRPVHFSADRGEVLYLRRKQ